MSHRRQVIQPLQTSRPSSRRLMNVDQPLVGADLKMLAASPVLERASGSRVDVSLGRTAPAQTRRTGRARRLHDLLRRRLDRGRVVRLRRDADLCSGCGCHFSGSLRFYCFGLSLLCGRCAIRRRSGLLTGALPETAERAVDGSIRAIHPHATQGGCLRLSDYQWARPGVSRGRAPCYSMISLTTPEPTVRRLSDGEGQP